MGLRLPLLLPLWPKNLDRFSMLANMVKVVIGFLLTKFMFFGQIGKGGEHGKGGGVFFGLQLRLLFDFQ